MTLWRRRAACLREDPDLFFPVGHSGPAFAQAEEARAVCRGCPVLAECRAWVEAHPDLTQHGVWAATTPNERAVARRGSIVPVRKEPHPSRPVVRNNPESPTDLDEVDWLVAGGVSIDEAARKYRIGVDTLVRYMEFRAAEQRKAVA